VSVITGIAMDHESYLGSSLGAIAAEKAGIVDPGGVLVTGPLPAAAEGSITARVAEMEASWIRRGDHYDVSKAAQAVGGWLVDVDGVHGRYPGLQLRMHGRHQTDHLATAIVAVEALFGRALDADAVREAVSAAESPGRIEVVHRGPLVIVDGAHNEEGIDGLAAALLEEFPDSRRILVVGFRGERDPAKLLTPLLGVVDEVIATAPDDDDAIEAGEIARAARQVFGEDTVVEAVTPVTQALTEALHRVSETEAVVVTGSLYVVGEARARFAG
jgi:dihydrofolate synthase/folylpolyglutamate synthase